MYDFFIDLFCCFSYLYDHFEHLLTRRFDPFFTVVFSVVELSSVLEITVWVFFCCILR